MSKRACAGLGIVVALVGATVGGTRMRAGAQQPGGTLHVALASFEEDNFDPKFTGGTTIMRISVPIYDYLTWLSPRFAVVPGLAERWEVSSDGRTYTFFLRQGVRFHNGDPITADDVKFSLERYMEKDAKTTKGGAYRSSVEAIRVVNPSTVVLQLKRPDHELLLNLSPYLGSGPILPRAYFAKVGPEGFAKAPVGSGPWRLVKHEPGSRIEYQAVPGHWRAQPQFDRLVLLAVPEESTRAAMLERGEVQIAEIGVQRRAELVARGVDVRSIPRVTQVGIFFYMSWLAKDQPISDSRVRRALALAVDSDALIKGVLLDEGERSLPFGVFPGATFADPARPSQRPIPYDPGRARGLLREAGHPSGFEMKLYSLSISGTPYLPTMTEVVATNWAAVGVRAKIIPIEFGALRPMFTGRDKALIGAATSFRYPAILTGSFNCDARGVLRSRGPQPLLESPKVDALCDDALAAPTPQQAADKMKLVFDEVDREIPMFTIAYANALYGVDVKRVGRWTPIDSFLDLGPVYETIRRVY